MDTPLDEGQQRAKQDILSGCNVLITGPAGTGKSTLMKNVMHSLEQRRIKIGLTAMTGCAAEGINGVTVHSLIGIGVPNLIGDFRRMFGKKEQLRALDVIIIDEVSMMSGEFFQHLEETLRLVRSTRDSPQWQQPPFGGIQVVLCRINRDRLNALPYERHLYHKSDRVVPDERAQPAEHPRLARLLWNSSWWREMRVSEAIELRYDAQGFVAAESMRQPLREQLELMERADRLGLHSYTYGDPGPLAANDLIENSLLAPTQSGPADVQPSLDQQSDVALHGTGGAAHDQAGHPAAAADLGGAADGSPEDPNLVLELSQADICMLAGSQECSGPPWVLNKVTCGSLQPKKPEPPPSFQGRPPLPEHRPQCIEDASKPTEGHDELRQKVLRLQAQLSALEHFSRQNPTARLPKVKFKSCDRIVTILPHPYEHDERYIGRCMRIQLPLGLAWAITVHKSQGMTLDYMHAQLEGAFSPGQVYVALSRAQSWQGLQISGLSSTGVLVDERVKQFYAGCFPAP
ncbi:hypothetical protein WJX84_008381 [Apatococcus fuscideae]|uniref:ATP-dependent DNA helicase n=1 Tax=Apatococcus fuscideae TaxID=2026836 RepID=A0AAW1TKH8_9CHLO